MITKKLIALAIASAIGSAAMVVRADAAMPLTYNGMLTESGVAASGRYDFEFALFGQPSGGVELDVARKDAVLVTRGSVNSAFVFESAPEGSGSQWLEVRVRPTGSHGNYETIGARSELNHGSNVKTITGPSGLGQVYDVNFTENLLFSDSTVLFGSVNVPAGSYVVIARMQMLTGSEADPGNSYRPDCTLSPNIENTVYRVGQESDVERYLTWQGVTTLDSAGAIQFSCRDGNGHTDTELSGKLTVMSVGSVAAAGP